MIRPEVFRSQSGMRPVSAFVVVAVVLCGVAGRVASVALADVDDAPAVSIERGAEPAFELVDARERTVAYFVDRLDLVTSPRSMWLAHTPDHMAARIAEVVGGVDSDEILANLLPDAGVAAGGWIEVPELTLSARQANAVLAWADGGGVLDPERPAEPPLAGVDVVAAAPEDGKPRYRLRWQPAVLLSRSEREAHGERSPSRWTRRLCDGLVAALAPAPVEGDPDPDAARDLEAEAARRKQVWELLMPTGHCVVIPGVPAERALELEALLREEGVSPLQMRLARGRDRSYPTGELEILGTWGRIKGDEPEPLPRAGLELLADGIFERPDLALAPTLPSAYAYLVHRNRSLGRTQYFLERREAQAPPRVHTTLDLDLLRSMRRELDRVMDQHEPAIAMAIALDLQTGDVLAVDSLERYPVQPFAPVYYAFTPGSTFKLITMAVALEQGVVRPDEKIDVGDGRSYRLPGTWRSIREAEGARTGRITAAECLAYSMNIGMVLIGQRVDAKVFREHVKELGYAAFPRAGLGPEHPGLLPPLPWGENWQHASVSFGHQVMTTLWQHAAGLAAIARGGTWRPLRLIEAVEQNGQRVDLPIDPGHRVFREDVCATVRDMMAMGAAVGTGRKTARPDLVLGTKTGTAEKVSSEVCAHLAGEARARAQREGRAFTGADFEALEGLAKPHKRSCYTSSMCIVGRTAASGAGGREVMVLVVVDEPTGKAKFGSDVAGPAAVAILAEALGRTRDGVATVPVTEHGFTLIPPLDPSVEGPR